ncbi:Oidioi.mRNA.OKI2018_I69.PAR.g9793.t1.cds [Oikopleura dioica]|uniref:Oidioi.mRNA.OKI2018_I69.PAR.g9793.t1.cds n=1 Tax=Oikopleura dioica TaxID=34765 RepID=A0ABN7RV05_OIKDI|nr:Oidioi.mRNA.OKI2018_I69.PAR.g9793.t1.cds [Oikopleura dioica]
MVVIFSKLRKNQTAPEVITPPPPYRMCCPPGSHRHRREAERFSDFSITTRRPRPTILMRSEAATGAATTPATSTTTTATRMMGNKAPTTHRLASCEQFTTKVTFFLLGSFFALSVYLLIASFQHVCNWPTVKTSSKVADPRIVRDRREGAEEEIAMVDLGGLAAAAAAASGDYEGSVEGSGGDAPAAAASAAVVTVEVEGSSDSTDPWPSDCEDPLCSYCRGYCYKIKPAAANRDTPTNNAQDDDSKVNHSPDLELKLPKLEITENQSDQFPTINHDPAAATEEKPATILPTPTTNMASGSSTSTLDYEFVDSIFNDFTSDGSAVILETQLGDKVEYDFFFNSFYKKLKITLSPIVENDQSMKDNQLPCFTLRLFETHAYEIDNVNTRLAVMWIEDDDRFKSWRVENWVQSQQMMTLSAIKITGRPKFSPRYDLEWELEFLRDA